MPRRSSLAKEMGLQRRIADAQQSIADHRAAHELYLTTTQARIDTFSHITRLLEECRALNLPIEPQATIPAQEEKMEVDEPAFAPRPTSPSGGTRLNAAALPFAPVSSQEPNVRASTPPLTPMRPPASGHALPSRPHASSSTTANRSLSSTTRVVSSSLPSRPSALRSVTGPAATGSLEEGELGGEEEGEVAEEKGKGSKRSAGPGESLREERNLRSRS